LIVIHTEAQIDLRKMIIELAKKSFPELEKLNMNVVFNHIYDKTTLLETKFTEHLESTMKFDGTLPIAIYEFSNNLNKVIEYEYP